MAQIILTGHGTFADGLASALHMVAGDIPAFTTLTFTDNDTATYPESLASAIAQGVSQNGSCLVCCDLKGGTPFNCAMMSAAQDQNIEVVAGVNLPILIEVIFAHNMDVKAPAAQLAKLAIASAPESIVRENQATFLEKNAAKGDTQETNGI